jgi:hypothetical protein
VVSSLLNADNRGAKRESKCFSKWRGPNMALTT